MTAPGWYGSGIKIARSPESRSVICGFSGMVAPQRKNVIEL
jgi:hypothetical protein